MAEPGQEKGGMSVQDHGARTEQSRPSISEPQDNDWRCGSFIDPQMISTAKVTDAGENPCLGWAAVCCARGNFDVAKPGDPPSALRYLVAHLHVRGTGGQRAIQIRLSIRDTQRIQPFLLAQWHTIVTADNEKSSFKTTIIIRHPLSNGAVHAHMSIQLTGNPFIHKNRSGSTISTSEALQPRSFRTLLSICFARPFALFPTSFFSASSATSSSTSVPTLVPTSKSTRPYAL